MSASAGEGRTPIDVEALISWAFGQLGRRVPWTNAGARELAFDHGWTAAPRRRAGFAQAIRPSRVCRPIRRAADADIVIAAIEELMPEVAAQVIACGRAGIRPNWLQGVEPRLVTEHRRSRKRHRRMPAQVWKPCHPHAIRLAREAYAQWWGGVAQVALILAGRLDAWEIQGFSAVAEPWAQETACKARFSPHNGAAQDRAPVPLAAAL